MGEALSKKWRHDPAYNEATETLTRSNKNTQQFVNRILTESNKLEAKNKELEKEIAKLQASIELKKTPSRDKLNQASSQEEPQLARTKLNRGHSEELPQLARVKLNRGHSEDQLLARRAKLSRGPSQEGLLLDGCLNKLHNLVGENETLKQENDKLRKDIKVLSDEKESALSRLAEEKEKGIEHQHKFKVEISNLKIEIDRADAKFREVVRDYETLNSRYKKQQAISSSERCQFEDELKDLRLKLDEKSSKFVDSRWGQEQKPEQTSVKEFAKNTGQAQVCVHYGDFLKEKSEQLANDFLQLHELYWKQAMTELGESGNEKTNIEFLLTILQNAYSFSAHMETRFREEFEQVLLDVSTRIKEVVDTTLLVREILEKLTSSIKQKITNVYPGLIQTHEVASQQHNLYLKKPGTEMGEALSKKWRYDPAYQEATETLTRSNKNTQQFVNKILTESNRLDAKNKELEKEIVKLKASIELKKTPSRDKLNRASSQEEPQLPRAKLNRGHSEDLILARRDKLNRGHSEEQLARRAQLNRGPSQEGQLLEGCLNEQHNLVGENETLKQENYKLKKEIKVLSNEKESALSRLSKLAGIQLTKGNSDITDLSDSNRPTKLSEKWSSLYTDEWSDAFDELSKIKKTNDNFIIEKELCDIVKKCYITCVKIGEKQMVDIKKHTWDIACCLHHRPDQLVEAAQTTMFNKMVKEEKVDKKAATMMINHRNNGADMARLFVIQKCMEELVDIVHERRKYDKKLLEYVKQETIRQFEHYKQPGSKNYVIKFVKRCTDLCWSMVIKAPSMVLVYDQPEGGPIDKNMFTVYTKQGPIIDFVVWPALILHTDGPILAKGAAQGKELEPNGYKETKIDSESKGNLTLTTTKTAISVKGETETNRVNWKNVKL